MVGQERVDYVNQTIDELIKAGHTEAAAMADWRDSVNESWADLLELVDTGAQLLQASHDLLKSVCTQPAQVSLHTNDGKWFINATNCFWLFRLQNKTNT